MCTCVYIYTCIYIHEYIHIHTSSVTGTAFEAAVVYVYICMLFSLITIPSQGQRALAYGVESGDAELVRQLIKAKADVNVPVNEVRLQGTGLGGQGFALSGDRGLGFLGTGLGGLGDRRLGFQGIEV